MIIKWNFILSPTAKRFGIEGCDTLISGLGIITDRAAKEKV